MRHICADILLDPTSNILRRSSGYYKDGMKYRQKSFRQKRQIWQNNRQNMTNFIGRQIPQQSDLSPGYYQTQFSSNNQFYNPNVNLNNIPTINNTINMQFNPQMNNYLGDATYTQGPQSCMAMTGERITVQSLAGFQPEGNTPSMSYQSIHTLFNFFKISN